MEPAACTQASKGGSGGGGKDGGGGGGSSGSGSGSDLLRVGPRLRIAVSLLQRPASIARTDEALLAPQTFSRRL